ncbi:GNAT family protein [Phytomonospora sp. NPDC050363]|uniref:GNAT family N-acetyltransferase n=1 Tax=Phytomonospora sp. NPDC050363 TaxID=3155642 RepID=UPI0033E764D0
MTLTFAAKPTLTGTLVQLRPVLLADAAVFAAADDPEVDRLTGTHAEFTVGQLEAWYGSRADHDDRLDLAIVELASGEVAGEVVLSGLDADNRSCGFRIMLFRSRHFGRGFGGEATRLILDHAFATVGVNRVELEVYAHNPRARHVYEKAGFVYEGTKREALLWNGESIDAHLMAMLRSDWEAHR